MEHVFEEYSTELLHKPVSYVMVIANPSNTNKAEMLCNKLLNLGWYVLCNMPLLAHAHFIHVTEHNHRSYHIHRIYNIT